MYNSFQNSDGKMVILRTFLFMTLFIIIGIPSLSIAQDKPKYLEYYQRGYDAYEAKRYGEAKKAFIESFNYKPHSKTAFFISCVCLELDEAEDALTYSKIAQTGRPPLSREVIDDAIKIETWAKEYMENKKTTTTTTRRRVIVIAKPKPMIGTYHLVLDDIQIASKTGRLLCVSKRELSSKETVASCLAKGEKFAIVDQNGIVRILPPQEVESIKAKNPRAFEERAFGVKYENLTPKIAPTP